MYVCMYLCMMIDDRRLSYATVILQKKSLWFIGVEVKNETKLILSWYVDMYSQQFTLFYCLVKSLLSSYSLLKFVYVTSRLRHSLVGHPPPKKNPELTNLYFFKGAVITASYNSSFGQWPVLIRYETWKIASELQNHSFVSSKYVF